MAIKKTHKSLKKHIKGHTIIRKQSRRLKKKSRLKSKFSFYSNNKFVRYF